MNKAWGAAFLVGCLLCAAPARAGKLYLGAGIGQASLELEELGARFDVDEVAYTAFVGYRLFKFLAVEANYTDLGDFVQTRAEATIATRSSLYGVSAVGILPVHPKVELFAKAGYVRWETEGTVADNLFNVVSLADDGDDMSYGAGLYYKLTERFSLRLELESYDLVGTEDVRFGSLGLRLRF